MRQVAYPFERVCLIVLPTNVIKAQRRSFALMANSDRLVRAEGRIDPLCNRALCSCSFHTASHFGWRSKELAARSLVSVAIFLRIGNLILLPSAFVVRIFLEARN
jgi:hypothetical protein